MNLETDIADWNGKTAADIRAIFNRYSDAEDFEKQLIYLLGMPQMQIGASWMLKHSLEQKRTLSPQETAQLLASVNLLDHWASRLHVLQSIPYLVIAEESCADLLAFLRTATQDENKFVRAWAYSGFQSLASQHSPYLNEARTVLEKAQVTETAASIHARVRKALAGLDACE